MRAIGIVLLLLALAIIYLYGMFLSTPPKWLDIAHQVVGYGIGILLVVGFIFWLYFAIKRLITGKDKGTFDVKKHLEGIVKNRSKTS